MHSWLPTMFLIFFSFSAGVAYHNLYGAWCKELTAFDLGISVTLVLVSGIVLIFKK